MAYIRWSILFRTLCKYNIYRLLMHSKLKHIQNSRHSRYCESLKYSLHRTLCNLDIFTTYVYSSPRTRGIWWVVFYRTLCNTGIFRTRGIFQTLSIYACLFGLCCRCFFKIINFSDRFRQCFKLFYSFEKYLFMDLMLQGGIFRTQSNNYYGAFLRK